MIFNRLKKNLERTINHEYTNLVALNLQRLKYNQYLFSFENKTIPSTQESRENLQEALDLISMTYTQLLKTKALVDFYSTQYKSESIFLAYGRGCKNILEQVEPLVQKYKKNFLIRDRAQSH